MDLILKKPELGEIRRGRELGYRHRSNNYVWHACVDCGKERWVQFVQGKPLKLQCIACKKLGIPRGKETKAKISRSRKGIIGSKHPSWMGGRNRVKGGYIRVWLYPTDPFYAMVNNHSYILEHRLIVAQSLGRCLRDNEIVHHLNGIRDDNRITNLLLVSPNKHSQIIPAMQGRIQRLEALLKEQGQLI